MKAFERRGKFWPSEDPSNWLPGVLRFDPLAGAHLETERSFWSVTHLFDGQSARTTLLGEIDGVTYTLDGCYRRSRSTKDSDFPSTRWEVDVVYEGCRLSARAQPLFTQISFRIAHLENWLGRSNIRQETEPDLEKIIFDEAPLERVSLIWERPPEEAAETDDGHLKIEFRPLFGNTDLVSAKMSERALITFTPYEPAPIDQLLPIVGGVQQLISMSIGRAAPITEIEVMHKPSWSASDLASSAKPVLIHAPFRGNFLLAEDFTISSDEMLFSAERMSGAYLIAQWLPIASKYQIAVDLLMTSRYLPVSDSRSRLAIASGAVEAFYNIKLAPSGRVKFADRLKTLAAYVGRQFHVLPTEVDDWSKRVKRDRTRVMHADPREKHTNVLPAYQTHADDLEYLLMLCILREIDEDTLIAGLGRRPERRSGRSEQLELLMHRAPLSGRPVADLGN